MRHEDACQNLVPAFPQRSPPWLLTTAACGGLRSAPDCRPRRALLHLSYSYAPPCGPALLVTQDPERNTISSSSYHRVGNHPENARDRNMSDVAIEDAEPDDQCCAHNNQKQFCGSSGRMMERLGGENTASRNGPWCRRANRPARVLFLRRFRCR